MNSKKIPTSCRLYGILDLGYVSRDRIEESALSLLRGGIGILQLRAKGVAVSEVQPIALLLAKLCKNHGCLFIVNDYPEIARQCDADGVHVGQDTPDFAAVRDYLGEDKIIGRSTHSIDQAIKGYAEGADYIGFGPLFPTATKPGRAAIGMSDIVELNRCLPKDFPVFCIGGVNEKTLNDVLSAGAKRVVIVSWLLTHSNIEQTTRELIEKLNG